MNPIIIIACIFILMICFPFIVAYIYYETHDMKPLHINQHRSRKIEYFYKMFLEKIKAAGMDRKRHIIYIDGEEKYIDGDSIDKIPKIVNKMILSFNKKLSISRNVKCLSKPVYSKEAIDVEAGKKKLLINALCSESDINIRRDIEVEKWMGADGSVSIHGNGSLGISLCSDKSIYIDGIFNFRRIYAPVIKISEGKELKSDDYKRVKKQGNIVSKNEIVWSEPVHLEGSIRADGIIKIGVGSYIDGNIFSDFDIYIGEDSVILGNIFSQSSVYLAENVVVGSPEQKRSIIAGDDIMLRKGDTIYGYVSCEKNGKTEVNL